MIGFNLTEEQKEMQAFFRKFSQERVILITPMILDSSMVEHSAVNRVVAGSSPARGVDGLVVKRLRHRPFTAVTGVQIPLESLNATFCGFNFY